MDPADATEAGILLLDDGELDGVARLLTERGVAFDRLRSGRMPPEIPPPRDLMVATPRHLDRVRRGSPAEAAPGRPLRVVALAEDSPAIRRRLARSGPDLLVRLPADPEIWRLLVARARYQGAERREAPRIAVGAPVGLAPDVRPEAGDEGGDATAAPPPSRTLLLDLSNRGCRLRTSHPVAVGDELTLAIPPESVDVWGSDEPLALRGRVRRLIREAEATERSVALVFDTDLPDEARTRLAAMINRWASGPSSLAARPDGLQVPPIPPCRLSSLPDLMLDDETDPPVHGAEALEIELSEARRERPTPPQVSAPAAGERRRRPRGRYGAAFLAESGDGPLVMIGRDLSPSGMRVERIERLQPGDRFRLALHGPGPAEPVVVEAEVGRDDGAEGLALLFRPMDRTTAEALEKLVDCLPDVTAGDGEDVPGTDRLGAILSEILGA